MIISIAALIIGIICRKDVGGIKTKCCRRQQKTINDNVMANGPSSDQLPEEIPLNKID